MKILFVNGCHPDDKIGGAELQSWLLAKELSKRHQVTYLAIRSDRAQNTTTLEDGVEVIRQAKKKKFSWRELSEIYSAVKHLSPDVIHMRMFEYIYVFTFISWLCRVPVIYHISHVFDCRPFVYEKLAKVGMQLKHAINFLFMRSLAGLICQTKDQNKLLGCRNQPIMVINNSAAPAPDKPFQKDEQLILWVGNIKPVKQPLVFTDLAASFKDSPFKFLMIGYPNDPGLAQKVKEKASSLANLEYIPGLAFAEVQKFFYKANVFVSTSKGEGYPNTFIQSIQAATPIVSLKLDPDETLARYQVGFCSEDRDKLRQDLIRLMTDKNLLAEERKNTEICLFEKFGVTRNGKALEDFLQRVVVKSS